MVTLNHIVVESPENLDLLRIKIQSPILSIGVETEWLAVDRMWLHTRVGKRDGSDVRMSALLWVLCCWQVDIMASRFVIAWSDVFPRPEMPGSSIVVGRAAEISDGRATEHGRLLTDTISGRPY